WKSYAKSLIVFSLGGWLFLYLILRTQTLWNFTNLNPQGYKSGTWDVTFNTVSSFMTNTNWQYYSGETTMSYFSQMLGLTVQNWLSAGVGNFWQDLVRTILYVLTPLAVVAAIVLMSQGVIQNFTDYLTAHTVTGLT